MSNNILRINNEDINEIIDNIDLGNFIGNSSHNYNLSHNNSINNNENKSNINNSNQNITIIHNNRGKFNI